ETSARIAALEALLRRTHGLIVLETEPDGAFVTVASLEPPVVLRAPARRWLPAGPHRLIAEADGHQPRRSTIEVQAGQERAVRLALRPAASTGRLEVRSQPQGAQVFVG